ncbi:hypothetical protein [Solimicrobium silvestre]|nr:hypothetical protein [Solimicrobium silvestre]
MPNKNASPPATRILDLESAQTLVKSERFDSASQLGAMRPTANQEIESIKFELLDPTGEHLNNSVMHFAKLPNNLEFAYHSFPATKDMAELNQSFIHVFGLASVLNWSSRFPEHELPSPDQVQLISGKLFSISSKFTIEQRLSEKDIFTTECVPQDLFPASKINALLTGNATVFVCKTPIINNVTSYWYIENSARYVISEIWDDGELQSKFKIVDLTLR